MPNNTPSSKEILIQILTIIDYKDNKETFANKFLKLSLEQAYTNVIASLPQKEQKLLEAEIKNKKIEGNPYLSFQKYIDPKSYLEIMTKNMQDFLNDYIKEIEPTLSSDQKQKLSDYLSSIKGQFIASLASVYK